MKVELDKSFPLPGSAEVAWAFLQDVEAVALCMPGAKVTERIDAARFKGTVSVKVGPATMSFRGEVEVRDIDQASRSLRLLGKGTDSTGTSGAAMDLKARIEPSDGGMSNLLGKSDVSMSGKAATFGGRVMNSIADQVLKQFAANFAARVAALAAERSSAEASASEAPTNENATLAASASAAPASEAASIPAAPVPAAMRAGEARSAAESHAPSSPVASAPSELNGLAIAWAVFKDWLRSLFTRKAA